MTVIFFRYVMEEKYINLLPVFQIDWNRGVRLYLAFLKWHINIKFIKTQKDENRR